MTTVNETPPEEGTGWADMFRGKRGVYTVLLNVGIGVHAIDVFVITTVMPAVVAEIGGVEFYAWTTMLYARSAPLWEPPADNMREPCWDAEKATSLPA